MKEKQRVDCYLLRCLLLLLGLASLLQDLLDDLLLLDQEGADDAVANAVAAPGTAVGALDGLLGLGERSILAGAEGGDAGELGAAVTALGSSTALLDVKDTVLAAGSLDDPGPVGPGVVGVATAVGNALASHFV